MKKLRDSLTLLPSPPKVTMVNLSNEKIGLDVNLNHLKTQQMHRLRNTLQSNLQEPLKKAWLIDEINANQVWCVLVPGHLYTFKDKVDETPINEIRLRNCQVHPRVFKKPYIAPKMNGNKMAAGESNSYQFQIEDEEGAKSWFGVESKAQLDEWVECIEQSIRGLKKPLKPIETPVFENFLSPAHILSSRSFSSSDLPATLQQTSKINDEGNFQFLIGTKKRSKPAQHSTLQTSSMDLYRLKEESLVKSAVSANDLRLSLPVSLMQNWAKTDQKTSSSNHPEGDPSTDNNSKKRGRFSLKRVFSWKKNDLSNSDEVTLSKVHDIKLADQLYYKSGNSKWSKIWCVVSDGFLYAFKANKPTERVLFSVPLADANLSYEYPPIGVAKLTRKDFIIELTTVNKSVTISAPSSSEQIRWIQGLTKESMSALRSAFHNSKQESECSDDSACSMSSVHSIPNALASTPTTETQVNVLPEMNHSKLSNFSTEDRDNGYTTSSEDFDNQSSVSSQNECCNISLSPCPDQREAYRAYSERSLAKNRQQQYSKDSKKEVTIDTTSNLNHSFNSQMDFASPNARPRSFSWNSEKCWNGSSTTTARKATASATLSSDGGASVVVVSRPVSLSLGSSPHSKARSDQKRPPPLLSPETLHLSPQIFMSGYLHRRTPSGKWQRLWFVLKGSTLFSHQKCEIPSTVIDSLDLIGSHIGCSTNSERKNCFEITTKDGTSFCYSSESEENLASWMQYLHNVTDTCSTSSPSVSSDGFFDSREDLTSNDPCSPEEQRQRVLKRELLSYVLQQIKEIQCRLKQTSDDNEASERQLMEDATCNMTRLVQRRMSTQIKLQSIKKQMNSKQMNSKKSLFNFGSGSRKKEEKQLNPLLVTEAQELNEKLNEIDRSLNQQQNSQIASSDNLSRQSTNSPNSGSTNFILSKSLSPVSKSHRLGLKPNWLRNSKPSSSKESRQNNRLSTPPSLLQTWGTELSVLEAKSPSPTPLQDSFLKSLDLADGVPNDDKPSYNVLYKTLPTKKNSHRSTSNPGSTHNKIPKYIKILNTEIEAFEQLATTYHSRRTEASSSSNA